MNSNLRYMSRAGKTFYFSSFWLNKETRANVAIVYKFCRIVDDLADEFTDENERNNSLTKILGAIKNNDQTHPIAQHILGLIIKFPEIQSPIMELVVACLNDKPGLEISTKEDLIDYARGVAGTVGRIMYPLLGGTDQRGKDHAEALGIGMQLTNIARDIIEDFKKNRIYLPKELLKGIDSSKMLDLDFEKNVIFALEEVLRLADSYYKFGLTGLEYLKPECRKAVEIAALCYSEIGFHLVKEGRLTRQRVVVGLSRKLALALRVYFFKRPELLTAIKL